MAETGLDVLQKIDKNPPITSENELQKVNLASVEGLAEMVQETAVRSAEEMAKEGVDTQVAQKIAFDPKNDTISQIMDKNVRNALSAGTDEYAIMAAIHKGTLEGEERSRHGPIINYLRDIANLIKSKIARK